MKKIIVFAIQMALVNCAFSAEFRLQHDESGRILGPFLMKNGAKVAIGKTTFTILMNEPALFAPMEGPLADKLQSIILPKMDFRNASPTDCVSYIREVINAMSATPIDIVVRNIEEPDPFAMDFDKMDSFPTQTKTVTFTLHNSSALVVLEEICKQTDLHMHEESGVVVIEPKP
jgi:hypothetical protein